MPALAFLLQSTVIAGLVRFVLGVLGVGVVSYVGIDAVLGQLEAYAASAFSGSGPYLGILGLMGVGEAVNLILSGCAIRLTMISAKAFRIIG